MLLRYMPLSLLSLSATRVELSTTPIKNWLRTPTVMHFHSTYSAKPALQIAWGKMAADMAKLISCSGRCTWNRTCAENSNISETLIVRHEATQDVKTNSEKSGE